MGYAENLRDYTTSRFGNDYLAILTDPEGSGTTIDTTQLLNASTAAINYFEQYSGLTYASGAQIEIASDIVIHKLEEWGGISDAPNHNAREADLKARCMNVRAKINFTAPRADKTTYRKAYRGRFDNAFEDYVRKNPGDTDNNVNSYEMREF